MINVEKMRRAREHVIEAGGHKFTIRRPTHAEVGAGLSNMGLIHRFVVGWDLKEIDLIPGGDPVPAEFDPEIWVEWVNDQPLLWGPISEAIQKLYTDHATALGEASKN